MIQHHKQLAQGRWFDLSFVEQMANIGSEVERTILWRGKNREYADTAFERALELMELTLRDPRNGSHFKLKELCRLREALIDYFRCDNEYASSDELFRKYFHGFAYAARLRRSRASG